MKIRIMRGLAVAALAAAAFSCHTAQAAPCHEYSRVVTFADGSSRLAQGTACLARDGQWRVTEEHLAPSSAYSRPHRAVYTPAAYYPAYQANYDPWLWVWPAAFLAFSYGSGYHHHHHHHHHGRHH
jgi:hypothetical protein